MTLYYRMDTWFVDDFNVVMLKNKHNFVGYMIKLWVLHESDVSRPAQTKSVLFNKL